jgi:hypothetical protein
MECGFLEGQAHVRSRPLRTEYYMTATSCNPCGVYLLDVVVRQRTAVFELLASEDQALLVGGDSLLVLDLALDIVDCVGGLDLEGDSLAREGLDEAVERVRNRR